MNVSLFAFVLLELLVVSAIDLRTRKISNLWSVLHIVIFGVLGLIAGDWPPLTHYLFPVTMVAIGFLLFLFHIMGAGDSKFLATLFLLVPTELQMLFLEKLLTVTIFVGTILLIMRFVKSAAKIKAYLMTFYFQGLKQEIHSRFSYAPVILISWILFGVSLWQ